MNLEHAFTQTLMALQKATEEQRVLAKVGLETALAAYTDVTTQLLTLRENLAELQTVVILQGRELAQLRKDLGR